MKLATPDITPAQVVAIVQAIIAVLVASTVDISDELSLAIVGLSGIIAALLLPADAIIRGNRAKIVAATVTADAEKESDVEPTP